MHPFFLLIKFPQSLSVYYNHNMVKYNGDKLVIKFLLISKEHNIN